VKKIRIGVNLIDLNLSYSGGLNTYTLGLLASLSKITNLIIFTEEKKIKFLKKNLAKETIFISTKEKRFIVKFLRFLSVLTKNECIYELSINIEYKEITKEINKKCDIFYCPLTCLRPLTLKVPSITSLHDIQHLLFPKNFTFFERQYRDLLTNSTIKHSTSLQVSSNFIKRNILQFFSKNISNKIYKIEEGVSNNFKNNKSIYNKNFLFLPAQIWSHKNHLLVLKALKYFYEKNKKKITLVMTGQNFNGGKTIFKYVKDNQKYLNVKYLGKVSFKKILYLYNSARFVICPSLYESSSLPIFEGIKIRKPIIASDINPHKELKEIFKINFFKKNSAISLAKLLKKIWNNERLIKNQINENNKNIYKFSWDAIARKYLNLFLYTIKKTSA